MKVKLDPAGGPAKVILNKTDVRDVRAGVGVLEQAAYHAITGGQCLIGTEPFGYDDLSNANKVLRAIYAATITRKKVIAP